MFIDLYLSLLSFMKKIELFFSFLLVPLDFLMLVLAGVSAYYIRFANVTTEIRPVTFELHFDAYFKILLLMAFFWLIIFAMSGLYNINSARKLVREVYKVILASSAGFTLIAILIFMQRELFDSRFIVLAGWLLAIVYVSFGRSLIRWLQRYLFAKGIGVHKVVLVGNSKTTDNLIKFFSGNKHSGYEVVKRIRNFTPDTARELADFMRNKTVDELIQSDPNLSKVEILRMYDFSDEHHVTFKYAADLLGTKVLRTESAEIAGIPVMEVKKTSLDGWWRIIKRIFDIVGSLVLIIIFSPLIIVATVAIKLDSKGPAFYLDYRSGQGGKRFLFYKFRYMSAHLCDGEGPGSTKEGNELLRKLEESEHNTRKGPLHKIKDDPRMTRVGKIIKRWSIDELPQFFNVLKGDMSLVGPRAHMTLETAKYEHHHKKLLSIKPGITGMAQVSGRSDLDFEEEVKLDTYYIENWSFLLDLAILVRTPLAVLRLRSSDSNS